MKEKSQGKGIGSDVFGRQVEQAQEQGVAYIACHAAKENPKDPDKPHNGYYTWPRMGYDQTIEAVEEDDEVLAVSIRKNFPDAKSILDIMITKQGRDWWKENGDDLHQMKFDLSPGSRSLKILEAYQNERSAKREQK
jgi:hypothetical protein